MKTTLDLPDDLMRAVKIHAARNDLTLKEIVSDFLRKGLSSRKPAARKQRKLRKTRFPLIACKHAAKPGEELTPDRISDLLIEQEAEWYK